jgi:hypothetical protein
VNHLLHPEADEEFAGAVRYYSGISPELGVRFYREMERSSSWKNRNTSGLWP